MAWTADLDTPCGWTIDSSCCPDWDQKPEPVRTMAGRLAIFLLWARSGRQFGRCQHTIRPCRKQCVSGEISGTWGASGWQPMLIDGVWWNVSCGCGTQHPCSCTAICEVELGGYLPEPTAVVIDGQTLPASAYRVDNGRWLVRTDGQCWPDCQDLAAPPGQPGTWTITYESGRTVPAETAWLAGLLACELAKACDAGGVPVDCKLPPQVTRVVRQGTQIEFDAATKLAAGGGPLGIPAVDLWLQAVNPSGRSRPLRVWSPDLAPQRVTTWP